MDLELRVSRDQDKDPVTMKITKYIPGLVLALVLWVVPASVRGAVTVYPESGSCFGVGALAGTGTNVFQLIPGDAGATVTTNLAVTVTRAIPITGAGSFQVWTRAVQSDAGGATNNGAITLTFMSSPDGLFYGNAFTVNVPSMGVTTTTTTTNIKSDIFGVPAYVKLYSIAHTNIGPTWVSNITYRVIKTRTQ
jgi:hypothetical protein